MPLLPRRSETARREQQQTALRDAQADELARRREYSQWVRAQQRGPPPAQRPTGVMPTARPANGGLGGRLQRLMRGGRGDFSAEMRRRRHEDETKLESELRQGVEHDDPRHGTCFRVVFLLLVFGLILFLGFAKFDSEANVVLPPSQLLGSSTTESTTPPGKEGVGASASTSEWSAADADRIESFYSMLNLNDHLKARGTPTGEQKDAGKGISDSERRRLRENHRLRQRIKRSFDVEMAAAQESSSAERGEDKSKSLVLSCGPACQQKQNQLQLAYDVITRQIDVELYSALSLDQEGQEGATLKTPKKRLTDPHSLRTQYNEKREQIEKKFDAELAQVREEMAHRKSQSEAGPEPGEVSLVDEETGESLEALIQEDKVIALEHAHDAFEILSNPESRTFYHLYGAKPPEAMKHLSARHGGYGQELLQRTHIKTMILAFLKFFDSRGLDVFVVGFAALVIFLGPALARLPETVGRIQDMIDDMETMDNMERAAEQPDAAREKED